MPVTKVAAPTSSASHHGSSISPGCTGIACIVSRPHAGRVTRYATAPIAMPTTAWRVVSISDIRVTSEEDSPTSRSTASRRSRPRAPSTAAPEASPDMVGTSSAQATTASMKYIDRTLSKVGSVATSSAWAPVGLRQRW